MTTVLNFQNLAYLIRSFQLKAENLQIDFLKLELLTEISSFLIILLMISQLRYDKTKNLKRPRVRKIAKFLADLKI